MNQRAAPVHILRHGAPLCGFSEGAPMLWPEGHLWVSDHAAEHCTCAVCRGVLNVEQKLKEGGK